MCSLRCPREIASIAPAKEGDAGKIAEAIRETDTRDTASIAPTKGSDNGHIFQAIQRDVHARLPKGP